MEQKNKYNEPAFPTNEFGYADGKEVWHLEPGMTLLDYFAGLNMQVLAASKRGDDLTLG